MQLNPYLFFNGQCKTAFSFYEQCLGGTIEAMLPYEGSPATDQVSADWQHKIMHAEFRAGNLVLMGSDGMNGQYHAPQGMAVMLSVDEPEQADRIFRALSENGTVSMPIQSTFWASRFGMLTDQFGIPWMINCDLPA